MDFQNFNLSIWHSLLVLAPLGGGVFLQAFLSIKPGHHYFFDPKHNRGCEIDDGEFTPHCQRYQDLSKLAIALSAGAIAFLINTLAGQKPPQTEFIIRVTQVAPIVVGFFGAAIALILLFMVLQTYWYEEYCHSPAHDSYSAWKYGLCNSLGWTGLVAFLLGFGWLAENLFK